ncbi:MAG: hypothetical protein AAF429_01040 [Pseudomonadota bacterium]
MAFLRPEINAWWGKWKEPAMLWIAALMCVYFAITSDGLVMVLIFLGLGAGMALVGIGSYRTIRVTGGGIAIGHVEVDERQVTYFLGGEGFSIAIDNLTEVALDAVQDRLKGQELFWVLKDSVGSIIRIPVGAAGAERMFENLAALEGLSHQDALKVMQNRGEQYQVIWSKN